MFPDGSEAIVLPKKHVVVTANPHTLGFTISMSGDAKQMQFRHTGATAEGHKWGQERRNVLFVLFSNAVSCNFVASV